MKEHKVLKIQSKKNKEVIDITDSLNELLNKDSGICNAFLKHTSAAISTADLDPGTDLDMLDAFYQMIPKLNYRHPHNPEHMPDHILSTLIGCSLGLPFAEGNLILGTWQRVVLFEFNGPREREILVSIL